MSSSTLAVVAAAGAKAAVRQERSPLTFLHPHKSSSNHGENTTSGSKASNGVTQSDTASPSVAVPLISDASADATGADTLDTSSSDATEDSTHKLPTVSKMMNTAQETLKSINSQASVITVLVEAKMARQKAIFERRLQQQERSNQEVISGNKRLNDEIASLKETNEAIKKNSHEIRETNRAMRSELKTLGAKLHLAESFITASMKATDDHDAKQLAVFQGKVQQQSSSSDEVDDNSGTNSDGTDKVAKVALSTQTDDDDEDDDDDDTASDGTSLLALTATTRRSTVARSTAGAGKASATEDTVQMADVEAELSNLGALAAPALPAASANPSDLLNVLSSKVAQLKEQEGESEAKLKEMFLTKFKAGTKRHRELLQVQRGLNSTRDSLRSLQTKLKGPERTRQNLEQRLHGLGFFLQRLAHVALAPSGEAPRLLDALPSTVNPYKTPLDQAAGTAATVD
jgi:hypothetical protein